MNRQSLVLAAGSALFAFVAACSDSPLPTQPARMSEASLDASRSEGRGVFHRYVAIGTSVSMGWRSDGVNGETQRTAWPAILTRMADRELSLPLIQMPGCGAPLVPEIRFGRRLGGESAADPLWKRSCAENEPGVTLPAGNVAITAATTWDALYSTPENSTSADYKRLYGRVLAPGQSQVTAMMAQNPKIVSVELGANELLGARSGILIPGTTFVPFAVWEPLYMQVLDKVEATAKHAVLVGLIDNAAQFPSFRSGAELWAARGLFQMLGVAVNANCENNPNLLFVAVRVPQAALERRLSCADTPGAADYVLTPTDVAFIDAQLAAMDAVIRREAERRGFAYFRLNALYGDVNEKGTFNPIALLTSPTPYGRFISLDGFHPSAEGAQVLADAAAEALNAKYGFGIPTSAGSLVAVAGQ